ncbi:MULTISPECIES: hypothetical protein, partial [unclassified Gordonia (in: high G+C Gram-positive bacteria)]|uniref:hypothetical protein n=2 Tax=unclassified Gordonia (in: high G+C Gram-positive bacteria) TaxID=2657482 RepID=UPI00071E5EBE
HPESTRSIAKALISMAGDLVKQEAFVREMLERDERIAGVSLSRFFVMLYWDGHAFACMEKRMLVVRIPAASSKRPIPAHRAEWVLGDMVMENWRVDNAEHSMWVSLALHARDIVSDELGQAA